LKRKGSAPPVSVGPSKAAYVCARPDFPKYHGAAGGFMDDRQFVILFKFCMIIRICRVFVWFASFAAIAVLL